MISNNLCLWLRLPIEFKYACDMYPLYAKPIVDQSHHHIVHQYVV